MGQALYANTHDAKFDEQKGFAYNNETKTDPQLATKWTITQSSDKPNVNKDQIIITAHDKETNTMVVHIKDSDFILQHQNGSMHNTTIHHFLANESYNRDNLVFIIGGSHNNRQLLGRSRTINISDDGYHYPNDKSQYSHQTSTDEMNFLKYVLSEHNNYGNNHGTFGATDCPNVGGVYLDIPKNVNQLFGLSLDKVKGKIIFIGTELPNNADNLVWYHFCTFLQMFYEKGDRSAVSFSLDVAHKINKDYDQKIKLKKVYYPECYLKYSNAGEVMFEADWFIKTLLYDLDSTVTSNIPNYKSYLSMFTQQCCSTDETRWHRLWIVPKSLKQSNNSNSSIWIDDIEFKIKLKAMYVNGDGVLEDNDNIHASPVLQKFVDNINTNMHQIKKNNKILQRLENVYRALLMAKFIYDHNVSINNNLLKRITSAQKKEIRQSGYEHEIDAYQSMGFQGGIDLGMDYKNMEIQLDHAVSNEKVNLMKEKLSSNTFTKKVHIHSVEYAAFALPSAFLSKSSHFNPVKIFFIFVCFYFIGMIILCFS
eukprot:95473_1